MDYFPIFIIGFTAILVILLVWVAKDIRKLINEHKQSFDDNNEWQNN